MPPYQNQRSPLQIPIPRPDRLLLFPLPPAPPPQKSGRNHRNLSDSATKSIQTNLQSTQITPEIELDLPPLEDAESIQIAISLVVAALARNRIDSRRAATILYALQLASTNARSINTEPYAPSIVRAIVHKKSGLDLAAAD